MKYHYNKNTGKTGQCTAKIKCRLGLAESEHFDNAADARTAFEESQGNQVGQSLRKKNESKTDPKLRGINWKGGYIPDVNGTSFEKTWNEHFRKLDDVNSGFAQAPKLKGVASLLKEPADVIRPRGSSLMTIEEFVEENPEYKDNKFEGEYIVSISARQGGGNRECYCDYNEDHEDSCLATNNEELQEHPNFIADKDDDFDSTYNTFYFDNAITKEQVDEYEAHEKSAREIKLLEMQRERISEGSLPPWSINAKRDDLVAVNKYTSAKTRLANSRNEAKKSQVEYKTLDDNLKKLANNDKTADFSSISRFSKNAISDYELRGVDSYFQEKAEAEKYQKMIAEAESLPDDSDLKKYLVGDRGKGSYSSTEKQGRRNVKVTKVYDKGSLLGEELKGLERRTESYKRNYDTLTTKVKAEMDIHKEKVNSYAETKNEIDSLRKEAWSVGWTGEKKDVPDPHEKF